MTILMIWILYSTYFFSKYQIIIIQNPSYLERYSCLFWEIKTKNYLTLYWFHVNFIRRLYFCIGIVVFYYNNNWNQNWEIRFIFKDGWNELRQHIRKSQNELSNRLLSPTRLFTNKEVAEPDWLINRLD